MFMSVEEDHPAHGCKSCHVHGGVPLLSAERMAEHMRQLEGWELSNDRLSKSYQFPDPKAAFAFVSRVGAMAEEQNHHPELYWWKRKVRIDLWTHKSDGLTEKD